MVSCTYASTTPVVNKEQCLCWRIGTWPRVGAVLASSSPSPETKCRLSTDFGVMPVLNQYRFQCWHGNDVQYQASTDGKLQAKLRFGAAPVIDQYYASTVPVLKILLRYWRGTKPVVKFHLGLAALELVMWVDPLIFFRCLKMFVKLN